MPPAVLQTNKSQVNPYVAFVLKLLLQLLIQLLLQHHYRDWLLWYFNCNRSGTCMKGATFPCHSSCEHHTALQSIDIEQCSLNTKAPAVHCRAILRMWWECGRSWVLEIVGGALRRDLGDGVIVQDVGDLSHKTRKSVYICIGRTNRREGENCPCFPLEGHAKLSYNAFDRDSYCLFKI